MNISINSPNFLPLLCNPSLLSAPRSPPSPGSPWASSHCQAASIFETLTPRQSHHMCSFPSGVTISRRCARCCVNNQPTSFTAERGIITGRHVRWFIRSTRRTFTLFPVFSSFRQSRSEHSRTSLRGDVGFHSPLGWGLQVEEFRRRIGVRIPF